jgi:hypothetical protein
MTAADAADGAPRVLTGGCLCGALRYEARGAPLYAGHCYCADCRKASGSGFVPYMGFARTAVSFTGASRAFAVRAANGNQAVRNFCPVCGSLVFGGPRDSATEFTLYAGSLDDPALFAPVAAIFTRDRPAWAVLPGHLKAYAALPP